MILSLFLSMPVLAFDAQLKDFWLGMYWGPNRRIAYPAMGSAALYRFSYLLLGSFYSDRIFTADYIPAAMDDLTVSRHCNRGSGLELLYGMLQVLWTLASKSCDRRMQGSLGVTGNIGISVFSYPPRLPPFAIKKGGLRLGPSILHNSHGLCI